VLNNLAKACGPFNYQTTIAETGASSIISLIQAKTPFILFDTDGDVFGGNFEFSLNVGLVNYATVIPFEFKFYLTLKRCIVQSITYAPLSIEVL